MVLVAAAIVGDLNCWFEIECRGLPNTNGGGLAMRLVEEAGDPGKLPGRVEVDEEVGREG